MQDEVVALFAYDRWANTKVLDACRKLTAEQYVAEPVPGWSSVRATISHIALATEWNLRPLAGDPDDSVPTGADLAAVDDVAWLLERAYRRFEELRPTLTPERLNTVLTLRAVGRTFTLPAWAMLRHIVNHASYHRGQVASKLRWFGIEPPNTDFFFWVIEQIPQEVPEA
ncbi:MAG: DinB family protein [Sporichthyaceae bacterium]|nr:DinB family protein [Sporichthyaceae bacterium]